MPGNESEWIRIDSEVRQESIISPWLFNVYMDEVSEDGRGEWRLTPLYSDDWGPEGNAGMVC